MRKEAQEEEEADSKPKSAAAAPATTAAAAASSRPTAAFDAAAEFAGARVGWVFKAGARGTGYYADAVADAAGMQAAHKKETKPAASAGPPPPAPLDPPPPMTNAEAAAAAAGNEKDAAAHTHDKGYKRWETFDEEADAAAVSAMEGVYTDIICRRARCEQSAGTRDVALRCFDACGVCRDRLTGRSRPASSPRRRRRRRQRLRLHRRLQNTCRWRLAGRRSMRRQSMRPVR